LGGRAAEDVGLDILGLGALASPRAPDQTLLLASWPRRRFSEVAPDHQAWGADEGARSTLDGLWGARPADWTSRRGGMMQVGKLAQGAADAMGVGGMRRDGRRLHMRGASAATGPGHRRRRRGERGRGAEAGAAADDDDDVASVVSELPPHRTASRAMHQALFESMERLLQPPGFSGPNREATAAAAALDAADAQRQQEGEPEARGGTPRHTRRASGLPAAAPSSLHPPSHVSATANKAGVFGGMGIGHTPSVGGASLAMAGAARRPWRRMPSHRSASIVSALSRSASVVGDDESDAWDGGERRDAVTGPSSAVAAGSGITGAAVSAADRQGVTSAWRRPRAHSTASAASDSDGARGVYGGAAEPGGSSRARVLSSRRLVGESAGGSDSEDSASSLAVGTTGAGRRHAGGGGALGAAASLVSAAAAGGLDAIAEAETPAAPADDDEGTDVAAATATAEAVLAGTDDSPPPGQTRQQQEQWVASSGLGEVAEGDGADDDDDDDDDDGHVGRRM